MNTLEILQKKLAEGVTTVKTLRDKADRTEPETATLKLLIGPDSLDGSLKAIQAKIEDMISMDSAIKDADAFLKTPRRTIPFPSGAGKSETDTEDKADDKDDGVTKSQYHIQGLDAEIEKVLPTGGFKGLGHFAWCVLKMGRDGRGEPAAVEAIKRWEDCLEKGRAATKSMKAPLGMFEESDPDGGILVPRTVSNRIYERLTEPTRLFSYLRPIPIVGNGITIPALLENSRANGSRHGGIQGYWIGEADQYTRSRPKFRGLELKLHKLTVMVYVTDELMNDSAVALDSYLGRLVPNEFDFKINDAIINGTGNGMPLGILNAAAKITQAAVASQGANTVKYANVVGMHNRVLASFRNNAVWLYNQEVEPQLETMFLDAGSANGVPVFTPMGGGMTPDGMARLKGRPMIPCEQCSALGTEGDLIFANLTDGYACITKGGIESFMSMHLRFDYDETAFKWRFRMDGQPYDSAPLTPFKGSTTYSSITTLSSTRT